MALPLDIARLREAMVVAMWSAKGSIVDVMTERGLRASGGTERGIRTWANASAVSVEGYLEADGHWRYVGSGRGPGRMPPVDRIAQWVTAKGLDVSPWAVAVSIGRRGSKDFLEGNPNAFGQGVDRWEGAALRGLEDEAAAVFSDAGADVIVTNWKRV